jgi:hypothetical protein
MTLKDKYRWDDSPLQNDWRDAVERSDEATVFVTDDFLTASECQVDRYLIRLGNEIRGGVCVIAGDEPGTTKLDDFMIHAGLFFVGDSQQKPVRRRLEQHEIACFAIERLVAKYQRIEMSLAPQFEDLRPFLWHNYHAPAEHPRFKIELRYTTYVDTSSLIDTRDPAESAAFRSMEALRQRHLRAAVREGAYGVPGGDPRILVQNYAELMTRQGSPVPSAQLDRLLRMLCELATSQRMRVYESRTKAGEVAYSVAYAWDRHRAYYLFGAGPSGDGQPWQGTLAHWTAFVDLARTMRIGVVDLEGVNSPQRGWFKLGFGGCLMPYYHVHLNQSR